MDSTASRHREWMALGALLSLAALLRYFHISQQSLWLDEHFSWWQSRTFERALAGEPHNPPAYFVGLYFWTKLFGVSEAAFRVFSVIPSVATVGLTYALGKRLFRIEIAWIAAVYQAFCSFQLYYAQEARTHAWLLSLVTLSSWFLLEGIEREGRRRLFAWTFYALLIALSLYAHFTAAFFFMAHGLYVLTRRSWRVVIPYTAASVAGLMLFGPWLLQAVRTATGNESVMVRRYLWLKFPQAYFSLIFGDTLIPLDEQAVRHIAETLRANAGYLVLAVTTTVILLLFAVPAFWKWPRAMLFTAVMATAPAIGCFLISFGSINIFDERYMLSQTPYVYLLAAVGCFGVFEAWRRRAPQRWVGAGAIAAHVLLLGIAIYNYYFSPRFGKEQWREAMAYLNSQTSMEDIVLLDPDYLRYGFMYYGKGVPYESLTTERREQMMSGDPAFLRMLRIYRHVWLLRSFYEDDQMLLGLKERAVPGQSKIFPRGKGIELYEFTLPAEPPATPR